MSYDPPLRADLKLSYDEGYNAAEEDERARIRSALKMLCNVSSRCGLNRGHIGQCSPLRAVVTVSMDRLEEILND